MTVEDDAMRIVGIDIGGSGIKGPSSGSEAWSLRSRSVPASAGLKARANRGPVAECVR